LEAYRGVFGYLYWIFESFKSHATRGKIMIKLLAALSAGLFAASVNAFAADVAANNDAKPAVTTQSVAEKPAAPAPMKALKKAPYQPTLQPGAKQGHTAPADAEKPAAPASKAKKAGSLTDASQPAATAPAK
jgi:hypothetical protein